MEIAMLSLAFACMLIVCLASQDTASEDIDSSEHTGLLEDCTTTDGWYEIDEGRKIAPRIKLETKDGLLHFHTNRGRLEVAYRYEWVAPGADYLTRIYKDYGVVDMDKYHYMVVNIKAKGSAAFFAINGFMPKLGYTTGTTCVDLSECEDPAVSGTKPVRLNIDLHDNMTTFVLDEIKLVSELTAEEKAHLIGRGLTIRQENLAFKDYHGLEELKKRSDTPPPEPDKEEMAIFRDTATGAVSTRLTARAGNDYFGEGEAWSCDGAALRFTSKGRGLPGIPVYSLADGSVTSTGLGEWAQWSPAEPTKLLLVSRDGMTFTVNSWDRTTGLSEQIVSFETPEVGGFTEVKRFTKSGKLIVAFRETPHMYVVDTLNRTFEHIELSTRLKDVSLSDDDKYASWHNCYTYEGRWRNLETGQEGLSNSYSAGHGCDEVRSFGPYLKLLPTESIERDNAPGEKIQIWANWQNQVVTDYGSFTGDRKWIFTNGTRGDVERQHVMAPSDDPGAVLRVARYFTEFSWESTTYSRPSPDYTKIIYNENCFGPTQLIMVYTRRPDPPRSVKLEGNRLHWDAPLRCKEVKGYNVYASDTSGRDFVKINDQLLIGTNYDLEEASGYYVVTSVEHSRLESMFSSEVARGGPRTYYFEAEDQKLTPPARRFYDGYCNNYQCVRINAESPEESARAGVVTLDTLVVPPGRYRVWARTKGKGEWALPGQSTPVNSDDWQWIQLTGAPRDFDEIPISISSADDGLKLDTVMITTEDFVPSGSDPRDTTAPPAVTGLATTVDHERGHVKLAWNANGAPDLHHYSVYCGNNEDFDCDNASLIRSVYKTSVTDAGMTTDGLVHYKVIAYDSRANASPPSTVAVDMARTP